MEIFSAILIIGVIGFAMYFIPKVLKDHEQRKSVNELDRETQREIEEDIKKETDELHAIDSSVKMISQQLGIVFPINYYDIYTNYYKNISIKKSSGDDLFMNAINSINFKTQHFKMARDDLQNLKKASELYTRTNNFYSEVAREVNKTGSISLIKELEHLYGYFTSPNLKLLLENKKWDDFDEIVDSITKELANLEQTAIKYQQGGDEKYDETNSSNDEPNEEKAYHVLGVSPDITDEQIKGIYRKLVSIYHPDKGFVRESNRFREINEAYEYLKKIRGFN